MKNQVTVDLLEELPIANVVEVVHGAWKSGDCRCPVCGEDKFKGLDADIWSDWNPNYCPNCGADMRGGGISDKTNKGVEYMAKTQS